MLNAHIAYKKSRHEPKMSFLEFTNDVISERLQGDRNAEHSNRSGLDKTPHENVLRLISRRFLTKISLCGTERKVMKRCEVCHKKSVRWESRYTRDQSPSKPGFRVDYSFGSFRAKMKFLKSIQERIHITFTDIIYWVYSQNLLSRSNKTF